MSISQLGRSINESPTLKLNEKARILRAKGEKVIHLGIGEPKNKAPISAILGSTAKLKYGDVKYAPTDGTPGLKKAIIRYTEENYGILPAPENVIVSNGAKQSLYNAILTVVDPQDEVMLLAPYWVSYPEMIKLAYGIPVVVTPEDGTFQHRMEDIKQATSSYTKAIIVNSPNNPSGVVYSKEFLAELIEFCEAKGIYVIMDDIYHRLVFDGVKPPSAFELSNQDLDNSKLIVVNGISKVYGMTGFRIGWIVASRKLVDVMNNIQSSTSSCPSIVSQSAAEGALTGVQSVIENLRLTIQNNRDIMLNELNTLSDIKVDKPSGTFYCLPDFRAYDQDSTKLADFLLEKALVVTVPGKMFGMEGHIRLSYAGSVKEITEGIERIKWALDPNAPNEIYIGDRKYYRDWL